MLAYKIRRNTARKARLQTAEGMRPRHSFVLLAFYYGKAQNGLINHLMLRKHNKQRNRYEIHRWPSVTYLLYAPSGSPCISCVLLCLNFQCIRNTSLTFGYVLLVRALRLALYFVRLALFGVSNACEIHFLCESSTRLVFRATCFILIFQRWKKRWKIWLKIQ